MCGLVGIVSPRPARDRLERAAARLAHRGPDDAGVYVGDRCGLALRRLSIIDLAGGHQPICNEDGRIWLTCNGEIFSSPELRRELEAAGHRFRTRSDIEVILHGYEEWGVDVVERIRGMFAFALWDADRRRLVLARDPFGIKPLYYAEHGEDLAFASEIRPLLQLLPELPRTANRDALWRLFEVGFVPSPLTAFSGVYKVPAAHTLVHEAGHTSLRRYWSPAPAPMGREHSTDRAGAAVEFAEHLRETVEAWRLSDVPIAALLSGGVDSASLAALLSEPGEAPVHTFSIGFDEASHDESVHARETARIIGSRHHEVRFSSRDFDILPEVVRCLEEPRCSATSIPIYLLYRACHQAGFKVVLTGEGADELLGGYHWFDGDRRAQWLLAFPKVIRQWLARVPLPASPAARRVVALGSSDPIERYALWQRIAAPEMVASVVRAWVPSVVKEWRTQFESRIAGCDPAGQLLMLESETRLVDEINPEVDRMSMAHSVEARPPFLDARLWELCARYPTTFKVSGHGNKRLLRDGMRSRLPRAVRERSKRGLATPHAAWWRSESLPEWAEEALNPTGLADAGYFEATAVARIRDAHKQGRVDASRLLMGVLTTQLWHTEVLRAS